MSAHTSRQLGGTIVKCIDDNNSDVDSESSLHVRMSACATVWELVEENYVGGQKRNAKDVEEMGKERPLPSRLGGLGSPAKNGFWCILRFKNPCVDKKI